MTTVKYPSLDKAIRRIFGNNIASSIRGKDLYLELSQIFYCGPEEILKRISLEMDLEIISMPKAIDLKTLPTGIFLTDLKKYSVIPILYNGTIYGVVCADPQSLERFPKLYNGSNIFISSFGAILEALETSVVAYQEKISINEVHNVDILVVEDNHDFAEVLKRFLVRSGFSVLIVNSSAQALECLAGSKPVRPELIVTDLRLPGMAGPAFIERIKADKNIQHIPILALSSDASLRDTLDVDAFVTKDQDPRILCMHAKRLVYKLVRAA